MIDDILRKIVGKRLTSASGTFHVYERRVSAEPIALWFGFDEERQVRFAGASDGWRIVVDDTEPKEVAMGESGSIRIVDLAEAPSVSPAIGHRVRQAWLIDSPRRGDVIGVRFDFDTYTIRILNWGDEMSLAQVFPQDADPHEIYERPIQ
jgi:hypothetical protein